MSLGLRKYILSDVKVEVTAISTPPPTKRAPLNRILPERVPESVKLYYQID